MNKWGLLRAYIGGMKAGALYSCSIDCKGVIDELFEDIFKKMRELEDE